MDKIAVLKKYLPWIVGHGVAWALAGWLGLEVAKADSLGLAAGEAILALTLVGLSVYDSIKGRKRVAR